MREVRRIELLRQMEPVLKHEDAGPEQPKKCNRCIWGRFEGTVQFCSRPKCVKER